MDYKLPPGNLQDFAFVNGFQSHFGYDNLVTVDPVGKSGGLALFYNNEQQVKVLYTSNRMIDVEAEVKGKRVFLTFVYGDPVQKLREQVWERLTRYGIARSDPWFIIGDLNEITGNHEKEGGTLRSAASFVPFNNMIRNCGLLEFPARGNKMSWQGKRGKGKGATTIRCRLDRALANEDWHTIFPASYTEYLGLIGSDHRPVVAFLQDKVPKRKGQFRFDKRWIGQEGLMESITRGWKEDEGDDTVDIVTRISNCRHEMAKWRKNNPPYGKEKIADLQKALEEVQTDDNRTQEEILEISKKLQDAYKDEEEYWQQKSRNMWNTAGDRSTKFYHALTKQRRARNRIVGLYDEGGNWITEEQGIEKVTVDYFDDLFTTTSPSEFDNFLEEITPTITYPMNQMLIKMATEEEVRQALFMMHPEKAPGPDGMTALFFQHSWHIIKNDIVEMVNEFLVSGDMDSSAVPDDSLFFCKAQKEECQTILRILKEYEAVSGGMGSYLGLPENIGGSKIQVFGFIQERLPKATAKKLTSAVAQFWWSPGGSTRGMHWKSWDKLVLSKEDGGLDFKDLTDFNTAMLGKQLWRLIEKPKTLFSRVFKGRYFRNASPLEPIRSYSPSYGWRSIISARSLALRTLVDPQDVQIIESIPLSRNRLEDRDGWHFTNNGKYTVKSGYQVERVYPDKEKPLAVFGPSVDALKSFCWKVRCPPKLKHFLWQLVSGCIAVRKNLQARGIKGDICCDRCGAPEESINHVFFECPPARQVWALSQIPSSPAIFPYQGLFTNMDYLFWRIDPKMETYQYAWILWYIWKGRNNKVFSNLDVDPRDTLKLAETESTLWMEAQNADTQNLVRQVEVVPQTAIPGRWCFIDGSWKDKDSFSGQGWYSTLEGFDSLMGARNVRASLSPLHSEVEALIWAME
ncbi:uncharacterized protein LOC130507599, partial [Raphanus sativus]